MVTEPSTIASDRKARKRPATPFDALDTYRRMFANAEDGLSAWWYFGVSFMHVEHYPTIPVQHIETVMIYKTRTLSPDSFRMDWWEIGYMRDPMTGELADTWINPVTGARLTPPRKFEEGPAHFTFTRKGEGLDVTLEQAHARIDSVEVTFTEDDGRVMLNQIERKTRGFPLPDGSMPDLDSEHVSKAETRLTIISSLEDLKRPDAPSSGSYSFELKQAPPWMQLGNRKGRCVVEGIMVRAGVNEKINPTAWARLQALFPDCFDGEELRPKWA
jgi:hypothetical protein